MNYIRYGIVFLAVALGAAILINLLNTRVDNALGSGAQLMVPAMIAALIEGQQFARKAKVKPNSTQAWGFTWTATLIATALNVALAFLAGGIAPEFGKLAIAEALSQQFLVLLGLYAGGYLVFNRIFVGIGAGNQLSLMRSRGEIE
ncbi:ABZJ_00895 family protein [Roseovarius sp. 2305UL8-3]|uniref:ABZJ_00895 family protein n=1 Tax=Roseovarius conchicola TaxID=3121636 RepID=UPI003527F63D